MVLIKSCFGRSTLNIDVSSGVDVVYLQEEISRVSGLPEHILTLYCNGRQLTADQVVPSDGIVHIALSLPGGKGGFGSMLRAIGAQIEKTTNREACRDLSGRRLRDINEEQRLKKWIAKQKEREEAAVRRRKERLERLRAVPKHDFQDTAYDKERTELPERIHDALSEGLQKASKIGETASKRKGPEASQSSKKRRLWLGLEGPSESDVSASGSDSESSGDSMRNNPPESVSQDSMSSANNSGEEMMDDPPTSSHSCETDSTSFSTEESSTTSTVGKLEVVEEDCDPQSSTISAAVVACASDENSVPEMPKESSSEEKFNQENGPPEAEHKLNLGDLLKYNDPKELEDFGLEKLKKSLMELGLKCGGTLQERAQRLWTVRGLKQEEFPPMLVAKPNKSRKVKM